MIKRNYVCLSLGILIAMAAGPLAAQPIKVTATIPFEFSVGGQTMPAGEYTIGNGIATNVLLIRTTDSRAVANAVVLPLRTDDGGTPNQTLLLFRRYENDYFLSEIWSSATPIGQELLKSRTERELIKSAAVKPQLELVLALARRDR